MDGMLGWQYQLDTMDPFTRARIERSLTERPRKKRKLAEVATLLTLLEEHKQAEEQGDQ